MKDKKTFSRLQVLLKQMAEGNFTVAGIHKRAEEIGLIKSNGKPYSYNHIRSILSNPFYAGYFFWRDEEGNTIRIEGKHDPMISISEFDAIQTKLIRKAPERKERHHTFHYTRLMQCGECNRSITAEKKLQVICTNCKHKFSIISRTQCSQCGTKVDEMEEPTIIDKTYYHCSRKNNACKQPSTEVSDLKAHFDRIGKQVAINSQFSEWLINFARSMESQLRNTTQKAVSELKARKTHVENRIKSLIALRGDGELSKSEFAESKSTLYQELSRIEERIDKMTDDSIDWIDYFEQRFVSLAQGIQEVLAKGTPNEQRAVLHQLGSNLILSGKKPYVSIYPPLVDLKNCFDLYNRDLAGIEPSSALKTQGKNDETDPFVESVSLMCARVKKIRTWIIQNHYEF